MTQTTASGMVMLPMIFTPNFLSATSVSSGHRPHEAQQHLVDVGEGRTSRHIPAMRDRQRVGGEADYGRDEANFT